MSQATRYKAENNWVRAGTLIGDTIGSLPVDHERPNELGGATPVFEHPGDWPMYVVHAVCPEESLATGVKRRGCGRNYRYQSFKPQYDDEDPVRRRLCDVCMAAYDARAKEREARELEELRAKKTKRRKKAEPEPTFV